MKYAASITPTAEQGYIYAGLWARFLALAVDGILFCALFFPVATACWPAGAEQSWGCFLKETHRGGSLCAKRRREILICAMRVYASP